MNTTLQEEKMAGNLREQQVAFQCAEAAIMDTIKQIDTGALKFSDFDGNGTGGLLQESNEEPTNYFDPALWVNATSSLVTTALPGIDADLQPRYIIKVIGDVSLADVDKALNITGYDNKMMGNMFAYRITARCTGASGTAASMIQGHYGQ